jgi:hypothetical protein
MGIRTALWILVRAPDSYGLILGLLIAGFILQPLPQSAEWLWVRVLLQGLTMMFALHTSRAGLRTIWFASALFGASFAIAIGAGLTQSHSHVVGVVSALLALLIAVAVPSMLRRILTAETVTGEIVIGALDVYILLGMFFTAVYAAIGSFSPTPFFEGHSTPAPGSYQFFSFVTMTTVGYGNLVPATQLGQSLAILEALLGQIYLVTLVARLVSAFQPGQRARAIERLEHERLERERRAADDGAHDQPPEDVTRRP